MPPHVALRQRLRCSLGAREMRSELLKARRMLTVLSDLDGQRRQLEASREKLHKADENIGMSLLVMKRMKGRATRNKISLVLMLVLLVGVIALMIYQLLTAEPEP